MCVEKKIWVEKEFLFWFSDFYVSLSYAESFRVLIRGRLFFLFCLEWTENNSGIIMK